MRILVAEDDADTRVALTQLLEGDGYAVQTASSGAELLELLSPWILEEQPEPPADVIITDIRMPGLSGLNIVEGLRANGCTLPIVVITAFADPSTRRRVEEMGVSALLPKPFEPAELERALERLVS